MGGMGEPDYFRTRNYKEYNVQTEKTDCFLTINKSLKDTEWLRME